MKTENMTQRDAAEAAWDEARAAIRRAEFAWNAFLSGDRRTYIFAFRESARAASKSARAAKMAIKIARAEAPPGGGAMNPQIIEHEGARYCRAFGRWWIKREACAWHTIRTDEVPEAVKAQK